MPRERRGRKREYLYAVKVCIMEHGGCVTMLQRLVSALSKRTGGRCTLVTKSTLRYVFKTAEAREKFAGHMDRMLACVNAERV